MAFTGAVIGQQGQLYHHVMLSIALMNIPYVHPRRCEVMEEMR